MSELDDDVDDVRMLRDVVVMIPAKAASIGHARPWTNGTIVTFARHMKNVGGQGFRQLGVYESSQDRWVQLPSTSIGIVNTHVFNVEDHASRIDVTSGRLSGGVVYMWYWVAFSQEFLWVRCDWLRKWQGT